MPETSVRRDEIRDTVREYLLTEFLPGEDPSALTDTTPLISGGILDSIASVKLVSFLEERFGVRFEAHEVSVDYLDTIDLVVDTVQRKLGG
jgi:acyl carrier protein